MLTSGKEIQSAVLPFELTIADSPSYLKDRKDQLPTLDEVKRRVIMQTLEYTKGRRIAAAKILGIERRQLNRLMGKLKINSPQADKNSKE